MRVEEVAREHQFREGFTLVDYAEVGLPVFRLTLEAVTTATRSFPTIQEFAMRCMALGENDEASIARMLGLREDVVRGAVDTMVLGGLVARSSIIDGTSRFALTALGEERLSRAAQEVVQEEMLVIDYDAIRRMPIRLAGENVVRAAELKSFGAIEIRPYPTEPPAVSELAIPEVSRAIRRQGGSDFIRTVLGLKRVVRRNNVFREAVALVFSADDGDEVQVAFAIAGKLSDAHERAFAEHGGPRKMGFIRMLAEAGTKRRLERLVGQDVSYAMPDATRIRTLRKEEADAYAQVRSISPAVDASRTRRSTNPAVTALAAARQRLKLAKHDLDALEIRPLACFEQGELLAEALLRATRSLVLTTAGLQPSILNPHLMRDFDRLISERVKVQVVTFLTPQTDARGGFNYDPLAELTKRSQNGKIELLQSHRTDLFFLVKDDDLAAISNRPFLGEMNRRSGFQRVEGIVTRHSAVVERIRELAFKAGQLR